MPTLSPAQVKKLLAPQGLQVNLGPVEAAMLPFIQLAMTNWKDPAPAAEVLPEGWRKGLSAAMIQWWKRQNGEQIPVHKDVVPFGNAARAYMTAVGGYLPSPERIPWGVVNLVDTGTYPEVLAAPIDWSLVSNVIDQLPAGLVKLSSPVMSNPSYQTNADHWAYLEHAFDWEGTPWDKIPWTEIPWARLDVSGVQAAMAKGGDKKAVTEAFINAVFDAYEQVSNESNTDLELPEDWNDGEGQKTEDKTEDKTKKKRDGVEWLLVGASLISAAAIAVGTAIALKRSRKKKS